MSKADLDIVLKTIVSLTAGERAVAMSALKASESIGGDTPKKAAGPDISDDIVLQEIIAFMHEMSVDMSGAKQLAVGARYATFKVKSDHFMLTLTKSKLSKTQTRALVRIAVSLLYDDCKKMGWATTSRTLMAHAHRLAAIVDRAFPGYARMGWLALVIKGSKQCSVKTK